VPPLVKLLLIIIGALLLLPEQKSNELSGIRKRRSRRLFYLLNGRVIPRAQVSNAKAMAAAGHGSLYAVWAWSAEEARKDIKGGRAERYTGQLGSLEPCQCIKIYSGKGPRKICLMGNAVALTKEERQYIAARYPIRPAIRLDRKDIYVGDYGDIHSDITNYLPEDWYNLTTEPGWVDQKGNWLTQAQAAKIVAEVEKTPIGERSIWQGHSAYIRASAKEQLEKEKSTLFGAIEPWQMTLDEFSNVGESQRAKAWGVRMAIRDRGTGKIYPGGEKDRLHLDVLSKIQPVQIRIKDIEVGFILPDGTYFTKWSKDTMKTPEGFRYIDEGYKADLHRLIVQRAKSEGKNVPREVLSQYNLGGFISHIPRMFIMSRIIKSLRE